MGKDEKAAKEKFKDSQVCKGFLIGMCPLDPSMLGGKRKFAICERIHSEPMRALLKQHPEVEKLTQEYEESSLRDLEYVVKECEAHMATEKQRIRTDVRRKKPPLPLVVNDRLSAMKRESSNMIKQAEEMDDDRIREKEGLITKANEISKDREDLLEVETKKAIENQVPEVCCEICGTAYIGDDGNAAHLGFRIHDVYKQIRDRIAELKPRVEERQKARRDKREEESKLKRKKEWDRAAEKEGRRKEAKDKDKDKDKDKEKDKDKGKDDKDKDDKGKDEKDKDETDKDEKGKDDKGKDEKGKDEKGKDEKDKDGEKDKKADADEKKKKSRSGSRGKTRN